MQRGVRLAVSLVAFAASGFLVWQFGQSVSTWVGTWLDYSMRARLSAGELSLLQSQLFFVVPATVFVTFALGFSAREQLIEFAQKIDRLETRTLLIALTVFALLLNLGLRLFIHRGADFTDDERLYWYQAQVLLDGAVVGPLPPVDRAFHYEFITRTASGDGQVGLFPIGQPVLLALSSLLGWKWLLQWLSVGALVPLTFALVNALWANRRVAALAAVLITFSPWWEFAGASGHGSIPTAVFTTAAWWCAIDWVQRRTNAAAWGAMMFTAVVFLLRSFDGVALIGGIAVVWLRSIVKQRTLPRPAALLGLVGAALIVAPQLYVNWRATGSAFDPAYSLWMKRDWPEGIVFGFGKGAWNFEQTPSSSFFKTLFAFTRIAQWFAGNPLLMIVAFVGLASKSTRDAIAPLFLWAIAFVVGYALFVFPSVHDFGSVYHLPLAPLFAGLIASSLVTLHSKTRWTMPALIATTLVAAFTFVSFQLERVAAVADVSRRPLDLVSSAQQQTDRKLVVLWSSWQGPGKPASWVFKPAPLPPRFENDAVIWAWGAQDLVAPIRSAFPDRTLVRLVWTSPGNPTLELVPP